VPPRRIYIFNLTFTRAPGPRASAGPLAAGGASASASASGRGLRLPGSQEASLRLRVSGTNFGGPPGRPGPGANKGPAVTRPRPRRRPGHRPRVACQRTAGPGPGTRTPGQPEGLRGRGTDSVDSGSESEGPQ
jgi:hypothetical protein